MEYNFFQWKADPYFSVAEEIQSFTQRLESTFRIWQRIDDTNSVGDPSLHPYPKSRSDYQIELNAGCDTLNWQVEEFEKEVLSNKSDKFSKINDQRRRLNFIHSIRCQVNGIKDELSKASHKFETSPGSTSSLSSFLNASVSSKSSSSLTGDNSPNASIHDALPFSECQLTDHPIASSPLETPHYDDSFGSSPSNSALDRHLPASHVNSPLIPYDQSISSQSENTQDCHSLERSDSPIQPNDSFVPYSDHLQMEASEDKGEKSENSCMEATSKCDAESKAPDSKVDARSVIQPQFWELFFPKLRKNKITKRRNVQLLTENCDNSYTDLLDVEKGVNLRSGLNQSLVLPYFHNDEASKELPKLHSHYFQWLSKPQYRLACLKPLQIAACIFLICGMTAGLGSLYTKKHILEELT